MYRTISDLSFKYVGALRLRRDVDGRALEYTHRFEPGIRLNRYGTGPFCDFELDRATLESGVYALTVGDEVKYIGECESLEARFGPMGYGHVSPRNCHGDGQSTNCKINALVLTVARNRDGVEVWFLPATVERRQVESRLIGELAPPWNGRLAPSAGVSAPLSSRSGSGSVTSAEDRFRNALEAHFATAERAGQNTIRIRSGDLHCQAGGYPEPSHRMPQCCRAMRVAMLPGDIIIESPPKGAGANLVIEYRLPRPQASLPNSALEPTAPVRQ